MNEIISTNALIDGSRIVTEALVSSGAAVFIGYPITPANLFYSYAKQRFPEFLAGPDEISVLQWMCGYAAAGKLPVTATAFPGLALMAETLNMAYMMELPLVIVVTQRLGPSTGSATTGAQGDLKFLDGVISGGFPLPVFSPSNFNDAWTLTSKAVQTAVELRTPVILLTSKEMIMTQRSFDISSLEPLEKVRFEQERVFESFKPYEYGEDLVPPFVPVGSESNQARFNASTHDKDGLIRKGTPESLENTLRLNMKHEKYLDKITFYDLDHRPNDRCLIVSWGVSSYACIDAITSLRKKDKNVALLIVKTLIPVSNRIVEIIKRYDQVIFAEENTTGMYKEILFGKYPSNNIHVISKFGSMISPSEIEEKVLTITC